MGLITTTMATTPKLAGHVISWGVAEALFPDELESGDRCVVQPCAAGVLIAVIDGAGHGTEAAVAARIAAHTLETFAAESPIALVLRCHEELRQTRGAVMTLAFVHTRDQTLTWLGIGNVEAALLHSGREAGPDAERVFLRAGVVGFQLPPLRADVTPLEPFDTLIMATDGINPDFDHDGALEKDPQQIADQILARQWKRTDDGLVVVARYLGGVAP